MDSTSQPTTGVSPITWYSYQCNSSPSLLTPCCLPRQYNLKFCVYQDFPFFSGYRISFHDSFFFSKYNLDTRQCIDFQCIVWLALKNVCTHSNAISLKKKLHLHHPRNIYFFLSLHKLALPVLEFQKHGIIWYFTLLCLVYFSLFTITILRLIHVTTWLGVSLDISFIVE